jgi:hypothetical protein
MEDLKAYTVISAIDLPHCEEGEHEHFARCEDCDPAKVEGARDGMIPAGNGLFKLCPTCDGTRGGGPSLGMFPCDVKGGHYEPGTTVHLSPKLGAKLVDQGNLADPSSSVSVEEQIAVATVKRFGYNLIKVH